MSPVLSARPSLQEAAHRVFSDDVGIGGGETKGTAPGEAGVTRSSRRVNPRVGGTSRGSGARDGTTRDEGESRRAQAARTVAARARPGPGSHASQLLYVHGDGRRAGEEFAQVQA